MFENKIPLHTSVARTPQNEIGTMPPQRLDAARERIWKACAEYNNFNPNSHLTYHPIHFSSCAGDESNGGPLPPNPAQLRTDLQELFERVCTLQSAAADQAYEDMSVQIWEMANDEYSEFDRDIFRDVVAHGLMELNKQGHLVEISDLATLRSAAPLF